MRADHATLGMQAGRPLTTNAYALLDHRTRSHTVAPDDAPPGRYLEVEAGDEVRLIPLERPIIHIGRGLVSDVRIEDPQVSRRHAIIAQRGGGVRVLDDRSSNGTFLNGRQVTVAYIADGDVLRVGSVVLRLVEVPPQMKASPVRRRIPLPVRAPGTLPVGGAA
ncbi:MAG TPA: FHA domain-containing protein [Solirubrobacteraceae bacterium]